MKRIVIGLIITMTGAQANWQGQVNRRSEDIALYRMYKNDAELKMFKKQNKLKHKKYRQAKRKSKTDIAWSQADASLFNHEQRMYKHGIRVGSFDWDDGQEVDTGIRRTK